LHPLLDTLQRAGFGVQLAHLPEEIGNGLQNGHVSIRHDETGMLLAKHETFQSNRMWCAGMEERRTIADGLVQTVMQALSLAR